MPINPSKSLHFDSWEKLLQWLPKATESQLITVFVWTGEMKPPADETRSVAEVRTQAFEHLVQRTRERLKRFLIGRCQCRDTHLADDVVQQVTIKLFLRAHQFDPRRSFWGWLYSIARHEYIDALRRIRPGDIGIGQTGIEDDEVTRWLEGRAAPGPTPEQTALAQERQQRFERAVEGLPSVQRRIVQLKREGIKGKEIAAELGISQAYVSQLFHEAGEVLRVADER
jgi:RNA polymerase sigma-70 factor, ECF subfamily